MKSRFNWLISVLSCLIVGSALWVLSHSEIKLFDASHFNDCRQVQSGSENSLLVDRAFSVLVWNLFKLSHENSVFEISELMDYSDFLLLQEATNRQDFFNQLRKKEFYFEPPFAFEWLKRRYGVLTASQFLPIKQCQFLENEPWIRIPKSAQLDIYPVSNGDNLMVVNIHSVNFTFGLSDFSKQLTPILNHIDAHSGPVIFGGDFNTWRAEHLDALRDLLARRGLLAVNFEQDERLHVFGYPLDHIFYRDLILLHATTRESGVSDHAWLSASFRFPQD